MIRALRMVGVVWSVLAAGAALGIVAALAWLLGSSDGARWAIEHGAQAAHLEVSYSRLDGRLLGPLELDDLTLHSPSLDLTLSHARLEWTPTDLIARRVRLDALDAGALSIALRPSAPSPEPSQPAIPRLPVAIEIARARLDRLSLQIAPDAPAQVVEGVEVDRLSWDGADLRAERLHAAWGPLGAMEADVVATLEAHAVHLDPLVLRTAGEAPAEVRASGTLRLDGQPSALDLAWKALRWPLEGEPQVTSPQGKLAVEGTPSDATAKGTFGLGDTGTVSADARYSDSALDVKAAWKKLGWPFTGAPRVTSAQGTLVASGKPDAYRFDVSGDLAAEGKAGKLQATGNGSTARVALQRLQLAVARSKIEGHGEVAWSPAVTIDADLALQNVDPAIVAPAWPGSINGRAKAATKIVKGEARSDFDVALGRSQLRGRPFELDAKGRVEGRAVTLASLEARAGETRLRGHGRVTPPFDVDAQLDSPDLVAVWPGLGGRASLHAALKGPLDAPHAIARGTVENFSYDGLTVAKASVDGDVDLQGPWRLAVEASDATGAARLDVAKLTVDGDARDHTIALHVEAPQAAADVGLHGAFDRRSQSWSGELASGRLAPRDLAPWTLEEPAKLRLAADDLALEPACWRSDPARACTQVTRDKTKMRTAFRLEKLAFAYFAPFLPPGWDLSGGVDGTGTVEIREGKLSDAKADLAIAPTEIRRDGALLLRTQAGTVTASEDGGRVQGRAHLPFDNGHIDVDGTVGVAGEASQRPLDVRVDVLMEDLAVLRVASPEITRASGRLQGSIAWTGTLGAQRTQGSIDVTDGRIHLATPGIDIEDLQAKVQAAEGGAVALEASGKSDGGVLRVEGRAQVAGPESGVQLRITGDRFQAVNMTEARAWVSPDLKVKVTGRRIDLNGTVDVPRAEITPVTFDAGVAPSSDQRIVLGPESAPLKTGAQFAADVTVTLGDKVHFEGFGLKSDLTGSVRVIEEPAHPASARGEVRLVDGRYKAYGQDLEIVTGRLLFNGGPPTEPALDMRAQRKPTEDVLVGVFVRGSLSKPLFQLYSTPTMARERQLSWLVLGRDIDATPANGEEHSMMASAALSLGLTGTDFLAQNLRDGLHLDDISVGSDPGQESDQARFTIGKYLSPKLYVSYGVGIFQRGQVFKLLYDLGHGFKLSTESGIQTGGDLLYSVETGKRKAKPRPEAKPDPDPKPVVDPKSAFDPPAVTPATPPAPAPEPAAPESGVPTGG